MAQAQTKTRLWLLVVGIIGLLLVAAFLYQNGMRYLEGEERSFLRAVEWASETLSTTGYGSDNQWKHPLMVLFVVSMQLVGIFLVPLLISIYVLPFLAERFEQRVARAADPHLRDHVIVYQFGPAVESLLQRLEEHRIPTLVIEDDERLARDVMDRGQQVILSRSDEDVLDVVQLQHARAIVANGSDDDNAGLVLRARQLGFTRDIYAFVEEPSHRKPIELAGATAAYTPRHIVAAALAAHATPKLGPRMPGLDDVPKLQRRELRVPPQSRWAGKTLDEVQLPNHTGATVVGQWVRSRLDRRMRAFTRVEPGARLELVGDAPSLASAAEYLGAPFLRREGPFVIAGFGEVGRKVHQLLTDAGEECRVIELSARPGVDVVGDVLDPDVLIRAGVGDARALILALNSDDATLFSAVIARDVAADISIMARVNHDRNLENIHRAGADFALSISDVSGQMLSSRLIGGIERVHEEKRRVVTMEAGEYAGRTVAQLPLRNNDASLLAIGRGGDVITRITPETRIAEGDVLWVCRVE